MKDRNARTHSKFIADRNTCFPFRAFFFDYLRSIESKEFRRESLARDKWKKFLDDLMGGRQVFKVTTRSRNNLNYARWTLKGEEWREKKEEERTKLSRRLESGIRFLFDRDFSHRGPWYLSEKKKREGKYRLDERSFEWNRTAEETTLRHCHCFFLLLLLPLLFSFIDFRVCY